MLAGLTSASAPLEPAHRRAFETAIAYDFGAVRIHADAVAAAAARAVGARAYTVGADIVFGHDEYQPARPSGQRLLTHELAHVRQQRAVVRPGRDQIATEKVPALEAEAEDVAAGAPSSMVRSVDHQPRLMRWDSPEHVALGDHSAGEAVGLITLECHDRDFPERQDPSRWPASWRALIALGTADQQRAVTRGLTYGEVVALAGDLYEGYAELSRASLREIYRLIPLIRSGGTTAELQTATGGRYLDLAARNVSHFSAVPAGQGNLATWRNLHTQALLLARGAGRSSDLVNRAWGLNAFADHYLTDAFSGGHVRTPRAALLAQGPLGNLESKIEHDLDNEYGVEVTNARGDAPWIAYGDLQLGSARNATNRAKVAEAVALSKADVAQAISQGSAYRNPSPFPAEQLVPRPTSPGVDRWTGRVPHYVAVGEGGMVRVPDDYSRVSDRVIRTEAPDLVRGVLLTDDDDVRQWVDSNDLRVIGRQSTAEKIRMIDVLLGGFFSFISDDDVATIERICQSVTTSTELAVIRNRFYDSLSGRMHSIGQRTRVRIALTRL